MKSFSFKKGFLLTLLVVTLLSVTGCGVKMWPSPQKNEDIFSFCFNYRP